MRNQIVTEGPGKKPITKEWALITPKNNTEKPQAHDKRNKNKFSTSDQPITTANRFTLLSNLEVDNTESTEFQNHGEQAQIHTIHRSTKQQTTSQKIPTIVNGQVQYTDNGKLPTSNNKNNFQTPTTNRVNKLKEYSKCSKHAFQKQHKVMIVGDSHARGCAAEVKHLLSSDFEVFGSINPEAGMKTIKDTASVKVQQLTKKDVVVLWGGSNDIARNNSLVGLKHIIEFLIEANHTNVILMTAPHRYDLITNSCVNKEVEVFNKKLHKKVEKFKKVEISDLVNERSCYTRHGQHLNSAGKDSMLNRIAAYLLCIQ